MTKDSLWNCIKTSLEPLLLLFFLLKSLFNAGQNIA